MNQREFDGLSKNVVEARTENIVLQSLCAMLVAELVLLKSPDQPDAELKAMMDRFTSLADAFSRQPMGKITAPIATEITNRVRVVAGTVLQAMPGKGPSRPA